MFTLFFSVQVHQISTYKELDKEFFKEKAFQFLVRNSRAYFNTKLNVLKIKNFNAKKGRKCGCKFTSLWIKY